MGHPLFIQTPEALHRRMFEQLRRRRVDAGQYFGEAAARTWAERESLLPAEQVAGVPLAGEIPPPLCVVDLGPGSGRPCVRVVRSLGRGVGQVVCVDTSVAMLALAGATIRAELGMDCTLVVADFLEDAARLRELLAAVRLPKLFLCLGGTAGNFNQRFALHALRSLLTPADRLVLGLGLYPAGAPLQSLEGAAAVYASEANCRFGLSWLSACGATPDYRCARSAVDVDGEEPEVLVIRAFYRFPERTVLTVGSDRVAFAAGEEVQYVESRRFPHDGVGRHLARHGLQIVADQAGATHGEYLCRRADDCAGTTQS